MSQDALQAEQHVYTPPQAVVRDVAADAEPEFYIVSTRKFLLLFFATFGLYQFYWCWKHWARYRHRHGGRVLPAARALFNIFYAHALNARIRDALAREGIRHRWMPGWLATAFVVLQIASTVLSRLTWSQIGAPWTDIANILLMLPIALVMRATQRAANAACGDPLGASNARLGMANTVWLVIGGLLWMSMILSVVLMLHPMTIDIDLPK